MNQLTTSGELLQHPSDASLVIDRTDANDDAEYADIGHGGGRDEQPSDSHVTYPPDPFEDLLSQYRSLERTMEEVRAENARLREMNELEAGRRDFLNAARRKFPTARVRTSIDVLFRPDGVEEFDLTGIVNMPGFCEVGIGVTWEEVSLKLSIKWQAHLAASVPAPRFTVEHGPGFGPDGSDLFNVVDATKDEPENVVDYRTSHPRMSGRLAKAQAEEMAAELNRDAAEAAGEFVVPALATGGAA